MSTMDDSAENKRERRHGILTLYYYLALAALGCTVVWHWAFGGSLGFFGTVAVWAVIGFIVVGFLNALGVFGKH